MPVVRNKFQDPSGSLPEFQWSANHSEEEVTEKRRNVTYSSNTSDTGLVRQQGDETPLRFSYSGKITTEATMMHIGFQAMAPTGSPSSVSTVIEANHTRAPRTA